MSFQQDSPTVSRKPLLLAAAVCLVAGFLAGFLLANSLNGQEQEKLRAEVARLRAASEIRQGSNGQATGAGDDLGLPTLTEDQLRGAVEKADASPRDATLQRMSGQALYLYATQKGEPAVLPEAARILERAYKLEPHNTQLAVMAANAYFLIARQGGDNESLKRARKFYEAALAVEPDDVDTRTSLGLTYFYDTPADPDRAAREYRRALQSSPRAEPPLLALVAALVAAGDLDEAERSLEDLVAVNPNNPELQNLRARLEQKRNAAKEMP